MTPNNSSGSEELRDLCCHYERALANHYRKSDQGPEIAQSALITGKALNRPSPRTRSLC